MLNVTTQSLDRLLKEIDQAIAGGQFSRAETLARQALSIQPQHPVAHHRLGLALGLSGRHAQAIEPFARAVALDPANADVATDLGIACSTLQRDDQAISAFQQALAVAPNHVNARLGIADVLRRLSRIEEAIGHYRHVVTLDPNRGDVWLDLGRLQRSLNRFPEAVEAFNHAAQTPALRAEALHDLGIVCQSTSLPDAVNAFRQCLALCPSHVGAHSNLGNVYKQLGRLAESESAYRQALENNPRSVPTLNNLGALLILMGRCHEAADVYRRALDLDPSFHIARTGYLYCLQFLPDTDRQARFDEHRKWGQLTSPPSYPPNTNDRSPDRRLRIGYVSADFRRHSVGFFIENILKHHDRSQVEVFCYAHLHAPDDTSRRLESFADHWRPVSHLPDHLLAQQVRADAIDILVDLHGHTAGSRLSALALKPAPVQVSYLGYPDTTGLSAIDYRLTDPIADPFPPPATSSAAQPPDCYYSERLMRLPECFLCYLPPADAPDIAPRDPRGPLTFVSFNALPKISPQVVHLWAQILGQLPDARLVIKAVGMQDQLVRSTLLRSFADQGVAETRISFLGHTPTIAQHLALYHQADIALDTFPYHGTTTTCEALYMGVPVICRAAPAGGPHASRVGVSLLHQAGLDDLVALDDESYVRIALMLASRIDRRQSLRLTLRQTLRQSTLMDARRFTGHLEAAYRHMWKSWCESGTRV